jgi:predicted permease
MWRRYLRFFGPNVAADVDDELRDHIARLESELRERGVPAEQIADAVRARFGDAEAIRARLTRSDESRHRRGVRLEALGSLGQDIAYALRRLRQRPGFTAAVVVVLALGVGATTAMFSAVDAAMLRPLPFGDPEQLVVVPGVGVPSTSEANAAAPRSETRPTWRTLSSMSSMIAAVGAYSSSAANLSDPQRPVRVAVGHATAGLFALLGRPPQIGREFTADEAHVGGPPVVILSYVLWQSHFGGRDMLGQSISLDGKPHTVVGIAPRGFTFPDQSDLWVPLLVPAPPMGLFLGGSFPDPPHVIARLQPGVTVDRVNAKLAGLWRAEDLPANIPAWLKASRQKLIEQSRNRTVQAMQPAFVGDRKTLLLLLLGGAGSLLLIACANVTNLLLSQAEARRQEVALRAVLGASRMRLVRQFLTESVLLAAGGAALGVLISPAIFRFLTAIMPPKLAGLAPPELDLRVLAFATAVALVTGVGFGLWPALSSSRAHLAGTVRGAENVGGGATVRGTARRLLLTAEVALSLTLLVGAGLMLRSFAELTRINIGFHAPRAVSGVIDFGSPPPKAAVRRARISAVLTRMQAEPGVTAVAAVSKLPLSGNAGMSLALSGEGVPPRTRDERQRFATFNQVSDDYFQTMGIALLAGRTFRPSDVADTAATADFKVAVISKMAADSLWPGQNPLGRWVSYGGEYVPHMRVVGVVANVRFLHLDVDTFPQVYVPLAAAAPTAAAFVIRGNVPPGTLASYLRDAVHGVDPAQPVYDVQTIGELVDDAAVVPRTNTVLIALFGLLAVSIAVVGVYGVVAYSVVQRRRELGIRAALGASGRDLIRLVSREMLWVMVLGLALGLAGAWAASRVLQSQLFGVTTHDPATFVLAPLALILPAAVATLIPARRAARTNPVDVIREE